MTYVRWRPIALRALLLGVVLTLRGSEPLLAFLMPAPVAVLQAGRGLDTAAWILAASLLLTIIDVACWERIVPRTRGAPAPHLLRDTLRVVIYGVAAACVAAFVFQRPPIAFWTASGASAVVLGIALRSIILGLFTGIAFSVELSFRMGDWLEVGDHQSDNVFFGKVVAMTWRTTRLLLEDHRVAVIPNSRLGELILINYSQHGGGVFRSEVHVHVSAAAPADRVMRVLHAAALALTHTGDILAEPEPRVIVGAVTAHGVGIPRALLAKCPHPVAYHRARLDVGVGAAAPERCGHFARHTSAGCPAGGDRRPLRRRRSRAQAARFPPPRRLTGRGSARVRTRGACSSRG